MDNSCARSKNILMRTANPKAQYLRYNKQIKKSILRVLDSGSYILGKEVGFFEKEFAKFIGTKYAIGVNSGTDALHIALLSCGIKKGDEVLTVSNTAVATASSIILANAVPKFVDIEEDTHLIDTSKIEKHITKKTKAIIPVHLYGNPVDMKGIIKIAKKYKLRIIEDCAQAHGAKINNTNVGNFGHAACFSFYPTKNLGAIGDGGMIITNNKSLYDKAKLAREYGWKKRYISSSKGFNSRLDELQAAILRVKLNYLEKDNKKRINIAKKYINGLKSCDLSLPKIRKNYNHIFHLFVIKTKYRNKLMNYLKKNNIITSIQYPVPIHKQKFYNNFGNQSLKVTEKNSKEILSLPIYPELTFKEVNKVIFFVKKFFNTI